MPNSCDIRLEFGVGGAIPKNDGSGRFYSMSDCGPSSIPVNFGPSEYTLDDGMSACKYNFFCKKDGDNVDFEVKDSQFKVSVPCNPSPAKIYIKGLDDAGTVSTYDGEKFCFGVQCCGVEFYFKVLPCVRNETGLILQYGSCVFQGNEQPESDDDSGNVVLGYDIINEEFVNNTILITGSIANNGISAYKGDCGNIVVPPVPPAPMPPWCSDIEAEESINLSILLDIGGNVHYEDRVDFCSYNLCGVCEPLPSCALIEWAGLSRWTAQKGKSLVKSTFDLVLSGDNSTSNVNNERFLSNQCFGTASGWISFNTSYDLHICRYVGKDVCFKIHPFGSEDFLGFYLKGGKPCDDGKVDFNHFGHLYYCGVNVEPEDGVGQEFFDVVIENNSFVISNHREIEYECIPQNGNNSSIVFGCAEKDYDDCIESNLASSNESFIDFDFSLPNGNHCVFNTDISEESDYSLESDNLGYNKSEKRIKCEFLSDDEQISSYVGEDICFKFYLFGSSDFLSFYLKGGSKGKNGSVCQDNFGCLFYCGKNVAPSENGVPVFHTSFDTGRVVYSEHLKIEELITVENDESKLDFSCNPVTGDDTDKFELSDCDSCVIDSEEICNTDIFIDSINEFSTIVTPDIYYPPSSQVEERLPWNGLIHLCEIVLVIFRTFYAFAWRVHCDYSNLFKEIANKFIDIFNNLNNNFQKSLFYNDKGLAEILYKALFKDVKIDGVSQDVSTLDSIDVTISDRIKDINDNLKCDDDSLACIVKNKDLSIVPSGSNSLPIINTSSDLLLNQIKEKLGDINDNLKCDDDSLACIVKTKENSVTVNPADSVVDVTIEANNSAFVSKAKYDFTDE